MAERKTTPPDAPQDAAAARAADLAHQATDVEEHPRDETVRGGRYEVGGTLVDANGEPLKGKKDDD